MLISLYLCLSEVDVTKRCLCCGQFFTPDKRVFKRQKVCRKEECRKSLKATSQKAWKDNNPEYSKTHYRDYVIPWRLKKRGVQVSEKIRDEIKDRTSKVIKDETGGKVIRDEMPPSKPLLELVLLIPVDSAEMIKDEIRLRKVDNCKFAAYG